MMVSEMITLPESFISNARLKIKCSDNIFFDINDAPLSVIPSNLNCNTGIEIDDDPIADGNYSSDSELSASGRVPDNGNVIFTSNLAVNLLNNFQVDNFGVLEVAIYPCTE